MPRRFLPAWRRQGSDRTDSLSLDLPPADLTDGNLQIRPEELERRKFCGRGGNATVYYLDHKKLGKIALKQVLEYGSADAIERNRLSAKREAKIWFELKHEHVLPFYGLLEDGTNFYLVSKYAEEGALMEYISRNPHSDRLRLLAEVASALAYLHGAGVIHGDIKAANVLVAHGGHTYLGDFGLSRLVDAQTSTALQGAGSIRWMSPELFISGARKTFASDVWAFGVLIYEVLTGQIPFVEYHDNNALLMALVKGTLSLPQFPSYLAADDRSEPALNIAKRCWALDSQQRPGMEIVHEALSSHLGAQSPNNEPRFQSAPAVKPEANEVSGDLPTRTTDIHESTEAPLIPSAEVHPLTHPPSGSRMTPSYHRLRTALRTVSQVYPALPMSFVQNAATTGIEALSVLSTGDTASLENARQALAARVVKTVQTLQNTMLTDSALPDPLLLEATHSMMHDIQLISDELLKMRSHSKLVRMVTNSETYARIRELSKSLDELLTDYQLKVSIAEFNRRKALDVLLERQTLLSHLDGATYGSPDASMGPESTTCLDGTRVEVLKALDQWAQSPYSTPALWLHGAAGTGKTTITSTLALRQREMLVPVAVFFFSRPRQDLCGSVVRSLAWQLVNQNGRLGRRILDQLRGMPDPSSVSLSRQWEELIVRPLEMGEEGTPPLYLVLDGIDEWSDAESVTTLLSLIHSTLTKVPQHTLKVLVTSRKERHVTRAFKRLSNTPIFKIMSLDDVPVETVECDIRLYLESKLAMDDSLESTSEWMDRLVKASEGLFCFASAAVDVIHQEYTPDGVNHALDGRVPLLHPTFTTALLRITPHSSTQPLFRDIIGGLVSAPIPMTVQSLAWVRVGLEAAAQECLRIRDSVLSHLGALFIVPESDDEAIRPLHTSLMQYFTNVEACGDRRFLVDMSTYQRTLSTSCLAHLNRGLEQHFHSWFVPDEAPRPQGAALLYLSLHWSAWLRQTNAWENHDLLESFTTFCCKRILQWAEVLALGMVLQKGSEISYAMQSRCQAWALLHPAQAELFLECSELFKGVHSVIGMLFERGVSGTFDIQKQLRLYCAEDSLLFKRYGTTLGMRADDQRGRDVDDHLNQ